MLFEYPLDLHYSQTVLYMFSSRYCLNTLWIYTTLKPPNCPEFAVACLNTLWIYTTLKQDHCFMYDLYSLNTLWIYTTLKRILRQIPRRSGLNTLWIYTTLKPDLSSRRISRVWIPSGFTLLSNNEAVFRRWWKFEYPLDLHYSQTADTILSITTGLNTLWIYTTLKQSLAG